MNKREQAKLAQSIRALFVRHNAAHFTHGVYLYAVRAAGSRTIPAMLRELARKMADNAPLTIEERIFLGQLLPALAEGVDVRGKLRIVAPTVGHRRAEAALGQEIVREIEQRLADKEQGLAEQGPTEAYREVAVLTGKTPGGVRKVWERAQAKRPKQAKRKCGQKVSKCP